MTTVQVGKPSTAVSPAFPAAARLRRTRAYGPPIALGSAVLLIYVFLYLPSAIIALYSFNTSSIMSWPPSGFTLDRKSVV